MMTSPGIPLIYYGDEIGLAGGGDPDNRRMMIWDENRLSPGQKNLRKKVSQLAKLRGQLKSLGRGNRQTHFADTDTWSYGMGGCSQDIEPVHVVINKSDSDRAIPIPAGQFVDAVSGDRVVGPSLMTSARDYRVLVPSKE